MILSTEGKFAYIPSTLEDMVYAKTNIWQYRSGSNEAAQIQRHEE